MLRSRSKRPAVELCAAGRRTSARITCAILSLSGLLAFAVAVQGLEADRPEASAFGVVPGVSPAAGSPPDPPTTVSGQGWGTSAPFSGAAQVIAPPTRIQLPALKVVAAIVSVRSVDHELTVPEDPMTVGWWPGGARPGSRSGTVVLDGHVDSASRGPGAFFRLTALRAGDVVGVTTREGKQVTYRVTARRSYLKATGLPADLFATDGPPRLLLITCGGQFDSAALRYRDNLVIFATPTR